MYHIYTYTHPFGAPEKRSPGRCLGSYASIRGARVALQNYIRSYTARAKWPCIYQDWGDIFRARSGDTVTAINIV